MSLALIGHVAIETTALWMSDLWPSFLFLPAVNKSAGRPTRSQWRPCKLRECPCHSHLTSFLYGLMDTSNVAAISRMLPPPQAAASSSLCLRSYETHRFQRPARIRAALVAPEVPGACVETRRVQMKEILLSPSIPPSEKYVCWFSPLCTLLWDSFN